MRIETYKERCAREDEEDRLDYVRQCVAILSGPRAVEAAVALLLRASDEGTISGWNITFKEPREPRFTETVSSGRETWKTRS